MRRVAINGLGRIGRANENFIRDRRRRNIYDPKINKPEAGDKLISTTSCTTNVSQR